MPDQSNIEALRHDAQVIPPNENFEYLLEEIGDASIVLLGEATHGTREFYHAHAEISKCLITEKGFDAIAVEADWPDAVRVNRHIQLASNDKTADEALSNFQRFPHWMWRSTEIVDLVSRGGTLPRTGRSGNGEAGARALQLLRSRCRRAAAQVPETYPFGV